MKVELIGVITPNTIVVEKFPAVIGRDEEVDVPVVAPEIALYHCMLDQIGGAVVVWDLQTGTGTFVNGVSVSKSALMPGDKLTLGKAEFVVQFHEKHRRRLAG
jgi:pSer/pThr/pTyr-binding forkhead associated (FHA) protein